MGNCEQILESAGALERLVSSQNMATVRIDSDLSTCVDLLPRQAKVRRRVLQAVEKIVGDQRDELVQFRPQDLTAVLQMDQPAVAHALYELNESEWFTYVPPFCGRAIRMLKREVPFEELEIDFAALEKRKAAEYDKLNRMVRFALSGACRQQEILHYFGEGVAGECHHCDNCSKHKPRDRHGYPQGADSLKAGLQTDDDSAKPSSFGLVTADKFAAEEAIEDGVNETVRKVLSGVARAGSRIACGKNLIAQMLCGSNSAKIKKLRLDQLTTFGLLRQLKQAEVATLIEILIAVGCLEQEDIDRFRPVLKLTPLGGDVMRGNAELSAGLRLPSELRLKLRWPAAKDVLRPKVVENVAEIDQDLAKERTPIPVSRPPYYWTWRLLSQGFSSEECLAIRGITREVLLDHVFHAAENGLEVRLAWNLSAETDGDG